MQTAVHQAGNLYLDACAHAQAQGLPWNRVQNGERAEDVRAEYLAMSETLFELEKRAMGYLEQGVRLGMG